MYNSDMGLGFNTPVEVGSDASVHNKCEKE
jgi:cold shock CspA family protein